ncbi:MAG: sigma-70 family RNA polymerase sigma factor, partial [Planctomycetota bacterium]
MLDGAAVLEALARAKAGDANAYGVVVQAYQARLRAFLAGYVPRAEWVEDLAQQAFVSAYQGLQNFQVGTDFYAWLRAIAYNHLRAELERANRRRRLERDYLLEVTAGELARRLEAEKEQDEERIGALRECVGLLSGTARELLRRYYGEGLSLGTLGEALGRTPESLKVTL